MNFHIDVPCYGFVFNRMKCVPTLTSTTTYFLRKLLNYRKFFLDYKENPEAPRLEAHSKQLTSESISAFDGDSASHIAYVREKGYDQEFDEKSAVVAFNLCGASALNEKQIKNLEKAMEHLLGEQEYKNANHWTKEALKMSGETSDQTLADMPSIPLDDNVGKSGKQTSSGARISIRPAIPYLSCIKKI